MFHGLQQVVGPSAEALSHVSWLAAGRCAIRVLFKPISRHAASPHALRVRSKPISWACSPSYANKSLAAYHLSHSKQIRHLSPSMVARGDKMRKAAWLVTVMVAYWLMQPSHVMALECVGPGTLEERYQNHDGIIVAEVLEVAKGESKHTIQLHVKQSFKGVEVDHITIQEERYWEDDRRESQKGEEYLYYLKNIDGKWENKLCSPSGEISLAGVELDYLKDKEIQLQPASESPLIDASQAPAATNSIDDDDTQSRTITSGPEKVQSSDSGNSSSAGLMIGWIAAIVVVILIVAQLGMRRRK